MEILEQGKVPSVSDSNSAPLYLHRDRCPACFASAKTARLEMQSTPCAEKVPLGQQGNFLSGYAHQRVFFSYSRCSFCKLLYCPTYFTQAQLDRLYENQNENMAEVPLAARIATQKAYFKLLTHYRPPAGSYLELGADLGLFAKFFSSNNEIDKMLLYEPNHSVHATLKENLANKKHKIVTQAYSTADVAAEELALVVMIHVLDHLLHPRQLLKDLYQKLKPGGVVFIVTHDESSFLARVLRKKWPPYTLQHPQLFQPTTLQNLLKAEGFKIRASKKTPNYFPLTHFIKGGLTALGLSAIPIPSFPGLVLPLRLGNIATIAERPLGDAA